MYDRELLIKLGKALYIHKKLAECAEKAARAVEYLKRKGVLKGCTK